MGKPVWKLHSKYRRSRLRNILAGAVLLLLLFLLMQLAPQLLANSQIEGDDYVEYWAAGRLELEGSNPYDPALLTPLQLAAGRHVGVPVEMWNPPWTLAPVMAFSLLPYFSSRLAWLLANIFITLVAATWTWEYWGRPPQKRWIAWLAVFLFTPTLQAFKLGQIIPPLFLGLAGFLYFEQQKKDWLAGAMLALVAIKPNSLYLFGLAVLVWAISRRRWKLLAGAGLALAAATLAASLTNPALCWQYIQAYLAHPPQEYATATSGTALRLLFGIQHFWLQFLPVIPGLAWLGYLLWKKGSRWEWNETIAPVLLVCMLTSPYSWTFDLMVLLIPLIQAAVWGLESARWDRVLLLYLAYLGINLVMLLAQWPQVAFWWSPAAFLAWYACARLLLGPRPTLPLQSNPPLASGE